MNATADTAQIDFQKLAHAHADHHAATKHASALTWLANWNGPVQFDPRDVNLTIDAGLAFACVRPARP